MVLLILGFFRNPEINFLFPCAQFNPVMLMRSIWIGIVVLVIAGVVLYFLGGSMAEQCVQINECKGCWKTVPEVISSPLCANQTCTPEPYKVQHNAIVDVLICACDNAGPDYANEELNTKISELYRETSCPPGTPESENCGYKLSAGEVCKGDVLIKWAYD